MARTRVISALLVPTVCAVLGLCVAASAPAAEPPWLELHSAHFTVITDAGEKKGREVALRFEQMRSVFAGLLMKDRLNLPVPLTILALKNDKNFYQMAPLRDGQPITVPGFFVPGEDQNVIVLSLFEDESWRAVAHSFAHMLLNFNYPPAQGWFDEGLAEYFSSIQVDNKQVEIGGDPELRSSFTEDLLQNQQQVRNPPKSLTELLGGQVWLSMTDLFTMKHDTSTYQEGTHRTLFYAQSWMVMHYLLHEKKLPETGTYFDLVLNQHVPVEDAMQKAYGMTPAQFEQAVKDYFHSLKPLFTALDVSKQPQAVMNSPQVYQFPVSIGPDSMVITSKPMAEADVRAFVGEIKIRIPDRREAGLGELKALATTPDASAAAKPAPGAASESNNARTIPVVVGNEIAHRALAYDHMLHGEFDAAAEELGNAAALNQRDMWIRYYLSVLKYRMAQATKKDMQGLANMMQDLRAVLEWYPEFADAYDLMAVARTEGGGPTAAMQAERAAMQLSPRNEVYVYHLAEIYVAGKQWEAARALLERLKSSSSPLVAAKARERLEQVATEQKYGVTAASAASAKLAPQGSPFDVLDQDAAKRAADAQTAQNGGPADKRPAKFLQGKLVSVDCSKAPAAVLTVVASGVVLKLRTADYKSLLLIGADQFSCGWIDRSVSVNYKTGGLSDGDLVSLEVR
jgi:tetratricopeptide (TPR) repeat protein